MKFILVMLIFCMTLFLYLHVYFHMKTSDDLEIFDIEQPSKVKLEEVCDLRQPMRMDFANDALERACARSNITNTYQAFDVYIRNVKEATCEPGDLYVPLRWKNALDVMSKDTQKQYMIASNDPFLHETGLAKTYADADSFLRPYLLACTHYDYLSGSIGAHTPFTYDIHYRNYFYVASGVAKVKLAPPKSSKYLHPYKDYHNFEFRSPVDPWSVQEEYVGDFEKIKCLEVTVQKGQLLFIPAFWWYSIEFGEENVVCSFKYDSFMSLLSTIHHHGKRFLQSQNVKRRYFPVVKEDVERKEKHPEDGNNKVKPEEEEEEPAEEEPAEEPKTQEKDKHTEPNNQKT